MATCCGRTSSESGRGQSRPNLGDVHARLPRSTTLIEQFSMRPARSETITSFRLLGWPKVVPNRAKSGRTFTIGRCRTNVGGSRSILFALPLAKYGRSWPSSGLIWPIPSPLLVDSGSSSVNSPTVEIGRTRNRPRFGRLGAGLAGNGRRCPALGQLWPEIQRLRPELDPQVLGDVGPSYPPNVGRKSRPAF